MTNRSTTIKATRAFALMLLLAPSMVAAQEPAKKGAAKPATAVAAADPKLKAIWEPVSYPADVYFNDVYFATPEVGWVAAGAHGEAGMILHTRDGGASWTALLGDPESSDPAFRDLRFIDARTGWVLQDGPSEYKLLHTDDGEEWSQVGSIERVWGVPDYEFISPRRGLYIDGNDNNSRIMRTSDGGRTWEEVFKCEATIQVEGLTKNVKCALKTLHFPSPRVGYAMGGAHGAKRTLFVVKTEDGGETWKLSAVSDVGGDTEVYFDHETFFTDEATGVVSLSDGRIYRTTDGGVSWKGIVGTPGPAIRFADPVVGWSFSSYRTLSYTTDGGRRWTTRETPFAAKVTAFSLPRRDRGFVVGEHGMIYRYRVVGPQEPVAPKALPAPVMPAFDTPLDEQVNELDAVVDALEVAVAAAPEAAAGGGATPSPADRAEAEAEATPAPDAPAGAAEVETGAVPPEEEDTGEYAEAEEPAADELVEGGAGASTFTANCCDKPLSRLQLILTAVTTTVPQFLAGHKNTNLLVAGLQMLTDLPGRINDLNGALRAFRKAPDKASAMSALERVSSAITALSQSTAIAFQKQVPPAMAETGEPSAAAVEVTDGGAQPASDGEEVLEDTEEPVAAEDSPEAEADEGRPGVVDEAVSEAGGVVSEGVREAEQEKKQKAKEDAKKAIKKKLRF